VAQALASLHAGCGRQPFSLEYGRHAETVALYCRVQGPIAKTAEKQPAAYPDLTLDRIHEAAIHPPDGRRIHTAELRLARDVLPIETVEAVEDRLSRELSDPLGNLLGVLAAGGDTKVSSHIAVELRPAPRRRILAARRLLDRYYTTPLHRRYRRGRWFLSWATSPQRSRRLLALTFASLAYGWRTGPQPIESKAAYAKRDQPLFTARIRLSVAADTDARARRQLAQLAAAFAPYTVNSNAAFRVVHDGVNRRGSLLSVDELAVLWHPPTSGVKTERLQQTLSRDFEPPAVLPNASERGTVVLGPGSRLVGELGAGHNGQATPLRALPTLALLVGDASFALQIGRETGIGCRPRLGGGVSVVIRLRGACACHCGGQWQEQPDAHQGQVRAKCAQNDAKQPDTAGDNQQRPACPKMLKCTEWRRTWCGRRAMPHTAGEAPMPSAATIYAIVRRRTPDPLRPNGFCFARSGRCQGRAPRRVLSSDTHPSRSESIICISHGISQTTA
jgi:hypothetical protein